MTTETFFDFIPVRIVIVLAVAYALHFITGWVVTRFTNRMHRLHGEPKSDYVKRQETIHMVFVAVTRGLIWLSAGIAIFRIFNVDVASVATGAGFVGIIVG